MLTAVLFHKGVAVTATVMSQPGLGLEYFTSAQEQDRLTHPCLLRFARHVAGPANTHV